jgi:hydroxymethylbilane synthase
VTCRLGTRASRLALVQAESVAAALRALGADVELMPIRTSGDRLAQVALADFGGKALFVKEIEEALVDGRADIAVHSLKDLPAILAPGLVLAAFPPREDPRDVLVTRAGGTLESLPSRSAVGTSSLRRRALALARRPDLRIAPIRGNVETRLAKLDRGEYDALILAKAGLDRLALTDVPATPLSVDEFLPAPGQGILGVEAREADRDTLELLAGLDDTRTRMAALAERSLLEALGAGCHAPVAGYAWSDERVLTLTGLVASPEGNVVLQSSVSGPPSAAVELGVKLAEDLLAQGAAPLLRPGGEALPR